MFIHTDPSPAHEKNPDTPLDKSNVMNSDVIPKDASPETIIVIFLLFGWSMSCLLFLYRA